MGSFGVPFLELERGLGMGQNRAIRIENLHLLAFLRKCLHNLTY